MKKFVLLLVFLLAVLVGKNSYGQCTGYCGGFSSPGMCFCDDVCWIVGDCCPDMCSACPLIGPNTALNCSGGGSGYHFISGKAFYDSNQNGTKEAGEYYLPGVHINVDPASSTILTNYAGEFSYFQYASDSVFYSVTAALPDWHSTTPDQADFYLDTLNTDTTGLLFGFFPDTLYYSNSLDEVIIMWSCAFTNTSMIAVTNNGTLPAGGQVHFKLDSALTFLSASYPQDSVSGNDIYFSFDSLQPQQNFSVLVYADPATTLVFGSLLNNYCDLVVRDSVWNPVDTVEDNIGGPVICSYDPNNKISLVNGAYSFSNTVEPTDKLEYVINFQNTGSAPALDVKVYDQLSSLLDRSTFEFLSASHNVNVSIDSMGLAIFEFPDINLPDSTSNEPLSHGYVKFRIGLISGVMPNDQVSNEANIYFDNNPPVLTNATYNNLSCFILPPAVNLSYSAYQLNTNLSPADYSFTWMLDGTVLTGETGNFINCTADGVYSVTVTNQYGCESTGSFPFYASSIESTNLNVVRIYPNPSDNNFGIYLNATGNYEITLTDQSGKIILSDQVLQSNQYTLKGNLLPAGVYYIQVRQDENVSSFYKIVKI
jgi:uncharacterized repeat protein (TIGR01451 family)